MIPNLPRPLLWTEIKTMDEFLNGDLLTPVLYDVFKTIQNDRDTNHIPYVNELTFFNELYYQLTRYYYEKPESNDYKRYYADIRTNLGQVACADLVMTMMYHYCRLRDTQFLFRMDSFMKKVEQEQEVNNFWMYFTSTYSTVTQWWENVPYPQKFCPVAPAKLQNMQLNWKKITRNYELETIQGLLGLWEKKGDKIKVAMILKVNLEGLILYSSPSKRELKKYNKAIPYLEEITDAKCTIKDSSTMIIEALMRENKSLKNEISKISAERDEYMRQTDKMSELLEKANKEIQDEVEEREKSNKLTRQQIEGIDMQMKTMIEKIGENTIPLKKLVDGIKEYIQMTSPEKGLDLLMHLSLILQGEPVWEKSAVDLKNYLINIRKENKQPTMKFENAQVTMQQPNINGPLNDIHDNKNVNMGGE